MSTFSTEPFPEKFYKSVGSSLLMDDLESILSNKIVMSIVFLLYISLLFIGATISVPSNLSIVSNNDKLLHFSEFFFLSILLFLVLQSYKTRNIYMKGVVLGVLFILLSEGVQILTQTRTFSFYDMIADILGFTIGIGVFKWIFFKQ